MHLCVAKHVCNTSRITGRGGMEVEENTLALVCTSDEAMLVDTLWTSVCRIN